MDLKKDILNIVAWLSGAVEKMREILKAKKTVDAALLLADIKDVLTLYLEVFSQVVPEQSTTPFPKNFWSQLKWIPKNIAWLQIITAAFSGTNPFEEAKKKAAEVATKWGF